jgi:catechol 2,3-dioxygenase
MHPITLFPGERRQVLESSAGDLVTYGAVHLNVTDLARSLVFWHELLGLQIVERTTREAHLGVPDATLIVLHAGAERRVQRGYSGIYHLAIHLPNEAEFARVLLRLAAAEYPQAPTDHVMSWATYLEDPDGIGLELSLETIDRFRGYAEDEGAGIAVIDNAGRRRSGVAPLDVEEVVSHLHDRDLDRPLPAGTRVGHVHLHVDDLQRAVDFYTESIGFGLNATLTRFGMADMSAGGDFPHRLAVNTWQGQGAPQPPSDSAGLRYFELVPRSRAVLDAITDRLAAAGRMVEERGQGFFTRDSAGNTLMLRKTDSAS